MPGESKAIRSEQFKKGKDDVDCGTDRSVLRGFRSLAQMFALFQNKKASGWIILQTLVARISLQFTRATHPHPSHQAVLPSSMPSIDINLSSPAIMQLVDHPVVLTYKRRRPR